jgi:alginate O-acetyltransferase complex protein AlgI
MLFNTVDFAIFLLIVIFFYWFLAGKKLIYKNITLLIFSYYFYASWDWRFLFLLIFSTALDYFSVIKMSEAKTQKIKKYWFWISISINLGFLGFFKYYNFFAESFSELLTRMGFYVNPWTVKVILPVGISFYTFHGLSYVIDSYKNKIKPERNFIDYAVFVSFFPLLVAGPIERATHLLPQIKKNRIFIYDNAVNGFRQILWGLFKKMVVSDNCAKFANIAFDNHTSNSGSVHLIGAVFFSVQIYCDFSGYSDIAIGTARLFGIDLIRNFAFPYFSRDIAEFWRRWHISLSSWFKDYLYIPLGGSKGGNWKKTRNVFVIFIVSGFWHGANWTFIVWGLLNAIYTLPLILFNINRKNTDIVAKGKLFPSWTELLSMLLTFFLTVLAWIFFRSDNVSHAIDYISQTFTKSLFIAPKFENILRYRITVLFTIIFFLIEWVGREHEYAIENMRKWPKFLRWSFYYCLIIVIFLFAGANQTFIYFQF